MLPTIWFGLLTFMLVVYVVLDGFDLGIGAIYPRVARTDEERRALLGSIGPVWDGNEVWLIAAGGTLFFAFPRLYAVAFSGFYLPLIMVLWLLMGRGVALELRGQIDHPLWRTAWDVVFALSSTLLALFLGIALGNVVRGVPLDDSGYFFAPLWTNFRLGAARGILDWYTLTVGLTALTALSLHGALWGALKTTGELNGRLRALAIRLWPLLAGAALALSLVTFQVQPKVGASFAQRPWGVIFPALAIAGLVGARIYGRRNELRAFLGSCAFLAGILASAAFGLYPWVLPAGPDTARSLTVHDAAASAYGLGVGLMWWVPGMVLVTGYFVYSYRSFAGKVDPSSGGHY